MYYDRQIWCIYQVELEYLCRAVVIMDCSSNISYHLIEMHLIQISCNIIYAFIAFFIQQHPC